MANKYNNLIIPIETWKDITTNSVPNVLSYYMISNTGKIYSKFNNHLLHIFQNRDGYDTVSLRTSYGPKTVKIHRILMIEFHPIENMDSLVINHKDGNKSMNYDNNLEWVTPRENIIHAYDNNLNLNICENHTNARLTNAIVESICQYLEQGISYNDIMENLNMYDIYKIIYDIHHRINWTYISDKYNFIEYENFRNTFTNNQVHEICRLFQSGIFDYKIILSNIGYDMSVLTSEDIINLRVSISKIRNGTNYRHISTLYTFTNERSDQKFNDSDIRLICECLQKGFKSRDIANELGIDPDKLDKRDWINFKSTISAIKTRKNFKDISKDYIF